MPYDPAQSGPYVGPGGVSVLDAEADALLELLTANPRDWNKRLRAALFNYQDYREREDNKPV